MKAMRLVRHLLLLVHSFNHRIRLDFSPYIYKVYEPEEYNKPCNANALQGFFMPFCEDFDYFYLSSFIYIVFYFNGIG